jgi:hypothetical protein
MYSNILKEIGIEKENTPWGWLPNDQRQKTWEKEREEFGFDDREMWNLDTTICELLYPRLKYFKENGIVFVDEPFKYENESMTVEQALDKILKSLEMYIKDEKDNYDSKQIQSAFKLLGFILPMLWN